MGFECGIVGLPNVGKSTLFNALTATAAAQSANYPFCTIEPNVGEVAVPDPRLQVLAKIASSQNILPTKLNFVDIAGLVRGASKGEGLGNQFLANIREVDAIAHVVRCWDDRDITHVEGRVDPLSDIEIIETELMLADMTSLEKRISSLEKKAKSGDAQTKALLAVVQNVLTSLHDGKMARHFQAEDEEQIRLFKSLQLLTAKPVLYVCNVGEDHVAEDNDYVTKVRDYAKQQEAGCIRISAAIEAEISQLSQQEQVEFLETLGVSESGLDRMIRAGYDLLDLLTFFTVGPKETHAWTVRSGALAPQAAGVIHSDFEHGFIRAETISYDDYVACDGEQKAKDTGKMQLNGKDYMVKDGDVLHFRFAN